MNCKFPRIAGILISVIFLTSCLHTTRFQSARTIGKDGFMLSGAASTMLATEDNSIFDSSAAVFPDLSLNVTYGVSDRFDIGLHNSGLFLNSIYFKYQFLGDRSSKFAMALEPNLETIIVPGNLEWEFVIRPSASLISSYHFQNNWAVFLEPRFVYEKYEDETRSYLGASIGFEKTFNNANKLSFGYSNFNTGLQTETMGVLQRFGVCFSLVFPNEK